MSDIRVDTGALTLTSGDHVLPCAIGRAGPCDAADKREGDGRTPRGRWPIRTLLWRGDRLALPAGVHLPARRIGARDGWSDAPADPAYNRPVSHPHAHSAERLWRDDGLYDLVLVLGHNDAPPVPGLGSAIFLHCWNAAGSTEGCVAIDRAALLKLLPELEQDAAVVIG